jgi:hypothetical protein
MAAVGLPGIPVQGAMLTVSRGTTIQVSPTRISTPDAVTRYGTGRQSVPSQQLCPDLLFRCV